MPPVRPTEAEDVRGAPLHGRVEGVEPVRTHDDGHRQPRLGEAVDTPDERIDAGPILMVHLRRLARLRQRISFVDQENHGAAGRLAADSRELRGLGIGAVERRRQELGHFADAPLTTGRQAHREQGDVDLPFTCHGIPNRLGQRRFAAPHIAELHDAGRASSSASMAVAAACFRAKLAGQPSPAGERTARVLAGYRRTAGDRGRGQARPFGVSDLAAVLATCHRPRRRGRCVESDEVALERRRLDAVIAGLLFMAGMRRSELSTLRWTDVVDSSDGDGILVTVRRSKTNQEGEVNDVRFVKNGVARALRTLRAAANPESSDLVVPLSAQMIGLRFTAAARAAGVESRVTAHSGRVGLASELTSRGASTTDVMLAGNWKTSRMVAHYSAGATAERGAVARYL